MKVMRINLDWIKVINITNIAMVKLDVVGKNRWADEHERNSKRDGEKWCFGRVCIFWPGPRNVSQKKLFPVVISIRSKTVLFTRNTGYLVLTMI